VLDVAIINQRRVETDVPLDGAELGCFDDASLTADGQLFHTVGAEMQDARAAVNFLVVGMVCSVEFDE